MALPGARKDQNVQQRPGNASGSGEEEKEPVLEEFTFEQMKAMGGELKDLTEAAAREQIKKIQEQKELEAQLEAEGKTKKKKKDKDDRINLSEIKTETEKRKGGLPDHIKALPPEHPIRQRWEKGFKQREDGTWVKSAELLEHEDALAKEEKQRKMLIIPLLAMGIAIVVAGSWYSSQLSDTRKQIVSTIKSKGLSVQKPEVKEKVNRAYKTRWLPELDGLLEEFKQTRRSLAHFEDNQEKGSYMQHIKNSGKKFDPQEALEWRTREIRKPTDVAE